MGAGFSGKPGVPRYSLSHGRGICGTAIRGNVTTGMAVDTPCTKAECCTGSPGCRRSNSGRIGRGCERGDDGGGERCFRSSNVGSDFRDIPINALEDDIERIMDEVEELNDPG